MANKLINQLIPAAANLQDIDLIEAQVSGEVFSRKFTGAQLRSALASASIVTTLNKSADTTLTTIIPAGYMLEYMLFEETAGNAPTLDLGTTAGGNQVFINQEMTASGITTIVLQRVFSLVAATTLYLNDDAAGSDWNGGTVNIYTILKQII
jgi:hypothetical protein